MSWKHVDCCSSPIVFDNSAELPMSFHWERQSSPVLCPRYRESRPIETDRPGKKSLERKGEIKATGCTFSYVHIMVDNLSRDFERSCSSPEFLKISWDTLCSSLACPNTKWEALVQLFLKDNTITIGAKNLVDFLFTVTGAILPNSGKSWDRKETWIEFLHSWCKPRGGN